MPYPYVKYAFTPPITGYTTLDSLVTSKYLIGASLPTTLGSVVTAENGDTYILGQAHDDFYPNTPTLSVNPTTFITSWGGGYYVSPVIFVHKDERCWFRKINETFIKTSLSTTIYNVKNAPYNATGDGSTDDTTAVQAAITACGTSGGTVYFPAGTYMVNTTGANPLVLLDNMNVKIDPTATVKLIANNDDTHQCFVALQKTNITIYGGGTIQGERATHIGSTGEWGMGIELDGCTNCVIENVIIKDCWGDGIYLGKNGGVQCKNIKVYQVYSTNNRRQGMSIIAVDDNVHVDRCVFTNIIGTNPESGIDVEPNTGDTATNVMITNCYLADTQGAGIEIHGISGAVTGIKVFNNVSVRNYFHGIWAKRSVNGLFRGNYCHDNRDIGIQVHNISTGNIIDNNSCCINNNGVWLGDVADTSANNTISNNKCIKNGFWDIFVNATSTTETNNEFNNHN
jgi:parallel beta-helix repeat protein